MKTHNVLSAHRKNKLSDPNEIRMFDVVVFAMFHVTDDVFHIKMRVHRMHLSF